MAYETPSFEALTDIALALGLGLLIGIERERHRTEKMVLAGVRTYPLVSLSGLAAAGLGIELGVLSLISVGAFVFGAFALMMYWVRQAHGTAGLTSPIALFATYFVGVLVGVGREWEALVAGLAIAMLLFTKERLHRFVDVLTPEEMEGALYFLVLAFILYPVLPPDYATPYGLVRPRDVLALVLLVSLISFVSFLAIRRWGSEYGMPFSGFLGGLVNSEATTASLARLHGGRPALQASAFVAVLLATGTMFLRNLAIAAIADPELRLVRAVLLPMLVASAVFVAWAAVHLRGPRRGRAAPLQLRSPFAFRPAFFFALWFAVVSTITVGATRTELLGDRAVYVAALGGLVSAGAVVASMGALVAANHAPLEGAAVTAVLASLLSAVNKPFIAAVGTTGLAARLVAPTAFAIAAAGALLWTI